MFGKQSCRVHLRAILQRGKWYILHQQERRFRSRIHVDVCTLERYDLFLFVVIARSLGSFSAYPQKIEDATGEAVHHSRWRSDEETSKHSRFMDRGGAFELLSRAAMKPILPLNGACKDLFVSQGGAFDGEGRLAQ